MRIEKYLKKVRIFLLKRKFYRLFLWSIILISVSLFVMIQLESIFYFHPKIKSFFLAFLCTGLVLEGTFGLIYFWKAKQDKIFYYKLDVIASSLGTARRPGFGRFCRFLSFPTPGSSRRSRILA